MLIGIRWKIIIMTKEIMIIKRILQSLYLYFILFTPLASFAQKKVQLKYPDGSGNKRNDEKKIWHKSFAVSKFFW